VSRPVWLPLERRSLASAREVAGLLRQAYPAATILIGGPHAPLYADADRLARAVDVVNVGEGFESLPVALHDRHVRSASLSRRPKATGSSPES